MKLKNILTIIALTLTLSLNAQNAPRARDFNEICDTLAARLKQRTSVDLEPRITKVQKNGNTLHLHFNSDLSFYPWHPGDMEWFRKQIINEWKDIAKGFSLGKIFTNNYELGEISTPVLGSSGKPSNYKESIEDPRMSTPRFITRKDSHKYPNGLDDRYIALWQSHGLYYDEASDDWIWQRAPIHNTVEDMFTQSFVLPFLIPMLENAGAYIITPRERDTQWHEIIIDNDPGFKGPRGGRIRKVGAYREKGQWVDGGIGFADTKAAYTFEDNPFRNGTQRKSYCTSRGDSYATWTPDFDERGEYAVYISYQTFKNSNTAAHYTVKHMGGESDFIVNQTRGGGTWIYLGTFEFNKGTEGYVRLTNEGSSTTVVSADAVKIGGGMGKLERGGRVSGVTSSMEGAHYWMQWAGVDTTITRAWDTDYTNDFASRGAWTEMMKKEKSIPVDLSLAFHSDAGITPKDSTIGTLAIYTLRNNGSRKLPDGRDRIVNRLLCDFVQSQVVQDIRKDFDPDWSRRGIWDKSYSECRTTEVPGMILESLSHQNFADMKLGMDPKFRFTFCRAVYKGILKTLSEYYGCKYVVQPLPVTSMSARLNAQSVLLSWIPAIDDKEPTSVPESYIVYTRIDGGAFDKGKATKDPFMEIRLEKGHIYSFKVEAVNSGGKSFPSEILSAGIPATNNGRGTVAIVNNFTRVSAPSYIDTPEYAGFTGNMDSGVPYIKDINYIGETYEFDRSIEFIDNDYPGHGATFTDQAGSIVAGNTFDYPYLHGRMLMELGYPFYSISSASFIAEGCDAGTVDLICGKQGGDFEVFTESLTRRLETFAEKGGNILVSGSRIASGSSSMAAGFLDKTLGIKLASPYGTPGNIIGDMEFHNLRNPQMYCVEKPDAIKAANKKAKIWLKYPDTRMGAAIQYTADTHRAVSICVPVETIKDPEEMLSIMRQSFSFLENK